MIHITITLDISTHSALRLAEGSKWISLNLNKRGTQFREEKYHRVVHANTEEGNYFSVVNVKDNSLKTFAPSQIGNKKRGHNQSVFSRNFSPTSFDDVCIRRTTIKMDGDLVNEVINQNKIVVPGMRMDCGLLCLYHLES